MKILSVTPKQNHRGDWWLIRASGLSRALATDDMFKASLAERARVEGRDVSILTSSGWFYDSLSHITLNEEPK